MVFSESTCNNSRWASLYLASGLLPGVENSLNLSHFVLEKNCGVAGVLHDLKNTIENLSGCRLSGIGCKCKILVKNIWDGFYLTSALKYKIRSLLDLFLLQNYHTSVLVWKGVIDLSDYLSISFQRKKLKWTWQWKYLKNIMNYTYFFIFLTLLHCFSEKKAKRRLVMEY